MFGTLTKSGDSDLAVPVETRLHAPPRLLRPIVDFVAGIRLRVHSKMLIAFLLGALHLSVMGVLFLLILNRMDRGVDELGLLQEKMDRASQMQSSVTSQMQFRAMALLTGADENDEQIAKAQAAFS